MLRALTTVALAPILLAQGLVVRRRTIRLPEAAGPREGSAGSGPRLRLLVLGDSAAAGVGAATQDEALVGRLRERLATRHAVEWRLLARSGDTAADALGALDALGAAPVDVALTSIGVNDVIERTPRARFARTMRTIVARLAEAGARRIVLSGLPPMERFPALPQPLRAVVGARARALDAELAAVAEATGATHLPLAFLAGLGAAHMAPDGFHPGPVLYDAWAAAAHRLLTDGADAAGPAAGTGIGR